MSIKSITISDFPPIENVEYELQRTMKVVTGIFNRYRSETNTSTLEYAMDALDGYCYVPIKQTLWLGRYVRYLSMNDTKNIKLHLGGFVVSDNGYTVVLKQGPKLVRVKKNSDHVFFMVMIDNDVTRIQMKQITFQ
jgi:hypothetical protein